jgi:hypothetical protein
MDQFGRFVVSLDFELMWGLRDHLTVNDYGQNILGVREAIPRMLDAFDRFGIRATWATVGFLFCESKDELIATAPAKRPTYSRAALSNYSYFDEIGCNEKDDPYFFGLGLLQLIRSCNGQEIGSHTFSHYYCLEDGQTDEQFSADLDAACTVASRRNIILKSLVFPRNQYSQAHLKIAASHGFCVFRGNEKAAAYRPAAGNEQSKLRRALRLADNYLNLTGNHVHGRGSVAGLEDVPSSRFLRPYWGKLARLDGLKLSRITNAMSAAARESGVYHLWWHPHNFGANTESNMKFLGAVIEHFRRLRDECGMRSSCMGDFA